MKNCAEWGARTDDIIQPQLMRCAPKPQDTPTLIVMTVGGNDMFVAAQKLLNGESIDAANAVVDRSIQHLEEAMQWIRDEAPTRFPAGVYVVFTNVYEFTDATGDLSSCPSSELLGFDGTVPEMKTAYVHAAEQYMRVAVDSGFDLVMLMEHFVGMGSTPTIQTAHATEAQRHKTGLMGRVFIPIRRAIRRSHNCSGG